MTTMAWRRQLYDVSGELPCYLINRCDTPYLERYYVGQKFGYTVYLHRFVRRDPINLFHSHSWGRGYSIVLAGSYVEERFDGSTENVNWWNLIQGNVLHRTASIGGPFFDCWTLFVHNAYVHEQWQMKRRGPGRITYSEYRKSAKDDKWWEYCAKGKDSKRLPLEGRKWKHLEMA